MSNRSISKILVIGCGSAGERHIRNLQAITTAEVIACDRSAARRDHIRDTYKVKVSGDYSEALKDGPAAVLVCTPTSAHIRPALAAARQGCHVFIEKPLSHTISGVADLIAETKDKNLVLMVGFNFRFHPGMQRIIALVTDGKIGRIISVRVHTGSYFLYRTPFHHWQDYRDDYAARKVGGGVILDSATHHLDFLGGLLGEVSEVFCYAGKRGKLALAAEDIAEILLKFGNGVIASLHVNFVQQPYQVKYEVIGTEGTITWAAEDNTVRLFTAAANKWQGFPAKAGFDHNETYIAALKHFLGCIQDKKMPVVDGVSGKRTLEIALAAKKSASTGRPVILNQRE